MVHYYYYVSAGAQCDESTRIWKVAVGTSQQCQRDYAFLVAHALQHGLFFEVVSSRSDEFVKRLRHSLAQFNVQLDLNLNYRISSNLSRRAAKERR